MSTASMVFVAWIGLLLPILIIRRSKRTIQSGRPMPSRAVIYGGTWFLQAAYVVAAWATCRANGISLLPAWQFDAYGLAVALAWVAAKLLLVGFISIWWKRKNLALLSRLAPRLEPRTLMLYVALCVTTGIAEELVFRLHFPNTLLWAGLGVVVVWCISSVVFGSWHAAQGVRGSALAGLLGGGNLLIYWHLRSIYPVMLSHAVYDMVQGVRVAWMYRDAEGSQLEGGPLGRSQT